MSKPKLFGKADPLPPRCQVGDVRNQERALVVQLELRRLGKLYRKAKGKRKGTYQGWLEFLHSHAPGFIGMRGVEGTHAVQKTGSEIVRKYKQAVLPLP